MLKTESIKIAYDVQPLLSLHRTGIEYVTINVLEKMLDAGEDITLLYFTGGRKEQDVANVSKYQLRGAKLRPCDYFSSAVYNALWLLLPVPYSWFFKYDANISHFQNNYVPPGVKGKTVATIHDIIPLLHPEWVTKKASLRAKLCARSSCRRATHIVTDSYYSKTQIVEHCGVKPEKVTVIPCGVDRERFRPDIGADDIEKSKREYGIKGEYFFYIGSIVPHKNLAMLIRAYAQAYSKRPELPLLILGGGGRQTEELNALIESLGMKERIRLIGYVHDAFVPGLTAGAKAFLFPSCYEGFGLPPLEAMCCGTPVICSNATSLPEVVCDAGILLNPDDVDSWAEALSRIDSEEELRKTLCEKGLERAKGFTRDAMMERLMQVYHRVMNDG